jgi:mannose-6-phosphate isomerase-like protein (cupin superfamily)
MISPTPRFAASFALAASLLALAGAAAAQAPAPDRLPPLGGPGVYRPAPQLAAALRAAAKASPSLATSKILITDRYSIQEVRRGAAAGPAVHETWSELHFILEGSGELTTGGRIVGTGAAAHIEGGVAQAVHKGDAMLIPPNTPHAYTKVDGALTYLEVRFADPGLAPMPRP